MVSLCREDCNFENKTQKVAALEGAEAQELPQQLLAMVVLDMLPLVVLVRLGVHVSAIQSAGIRPCVSFILLVRSLF